MSDLPPADWYTDPEDESQYRYWDGSQWTDHRAPRHSADPADDADRAHRGINDLLAGTWRLFTANWRPFLIIYALAAAIYFGGEQLMRAGADDLFGDTLVALFNELETLDAESDNAGALLEDRWNDVRDHVSSLSSSTLARGALLVAIGALVAVVVNIAQYAAFGHLAVRRLADQPATTATALVAGLRRVVRVLGVMLMLGVMISAACMVAALVVGVLLVVSGPLGAVVGVLSVVALLAAILGAVPLALLTVMTAAVGPPQPSMRYARNLLKGRYWPTLGRTVLVLVLSAVALGVVVLIAAAFGSLAGPLNLATLYVLGVLPEALGIIALFILYRDLGGESG